jgi:hypothetical protein
MAPRLPIPDRPRDEIDALMPGAPDWLKEVARSVARRLQQPKSADGQKVRP